MSYRPTDSSTSRSLPSSRPSRLWPRIARILADGVTACRGLCGPIIAYLLLFTEQNLIAFWLFVGAILTDLIDGWLARRAGGPSVLGSLLDPLADKLLNNSTWIALGIVGWAPLWLVIPTLLRDALVSICWAAAKQRNIDFEANRPGQVMVAYEGTALAVLVFHGPWLDVHWPTVGTVIGSIAFGLSLWSAGLYASRPLTAAP